MVSCHHCHEQDEAAQLWLQMTKRWARQDALQRFKLLPKHTKKEVFRQDFLLFHQLNFQKLTLEKYYSKPIVVQKCVWRRIAKRKETMKIIFGGSGYWVGWLLSIFEMLFSFQTQIKYLKLLPSMQFMMWKPNQPQILFSLSLSCLHLSISSNLIFTNVVHIW